LLASFAANRNFGCENLIAAGVYRLCPCPRVIRNFLQIIDDGHVPCVSSKDCFRLRGKFCWKDFQDPRLTAYGQFGLDISAVLMKKEASQSSLSCEEIHFSVRLL
jgi:hypothetical protein